MGPSKLLRDSREMAAPQLAASEEERLQKLFERKLDAAGTDRHQVVRILTQRAKWHLRNGRPHDARADAETAISTGDKSKETPFAVLGSALYTLNLFEQSAAAYDAHLEWHTSDQDVVAARDDAKRQARASKLDQELKPAVESFARAKQSGVANILDQNWKGAESDYSAAIAAMGGLLDQMGDGATTNSLRERLEAVKDSMVREMSAKADLSRV